MSKPDDIEQWAWDEAKKHEMAAFAARSLGRKVTDTEVIARAILSERTKAAEIYEECAKIVEARVELFTSYGSGLTGRNALKEAASSIRSQAIRKGGKE